MIDEKQLIREFEMLDDNYNLFRMRSAAKIRAGIRRIINSQPKIGKWIKCAERLPTMEECQKNDCRFVVTDGNRCYQCYFDYVEKQFVQIDNKLNLCVDSCVVAWHPFPEPYRVDNLLYCDDEVADPYMSHIMQRFMRRL